LDAKLPIVSDEHKAQANQIKARTLVIWGLDDTALTSDCLTGLNEFVPDLKIVEVPGAGHGVIHERPDLISKLIYDFITH